MPADNPLTSSGSGLPGICSQLYVYGAVPPFTVTLIAPLFKPHVAGVTTCVIVNAAGWVTVPQTVAVQPLPSVTVTQYVPGARPIRSFTLFVPAMCAQSYVNGAVPPTIVSDNVPVFVPKHNAAVGVAVTVGGVGSVKVQLAVLVQPALSVTVTVYVPAFRPDTSSLIVNSGAPQK